MCNAFLHFYVFISTYWGVYVFMYIKCAALTHCHKWTRLRLMYFYAVACHRSNFQQPRRLREDGGNYNNGVIGNKENFNIFQLCGSRKKLN